MNRYEHAAVRRLFAQVADEQTVTTRCSHCPWERTGLLPETREAFRAHLADAHPLVRETMPKRRSQAMTAGALAAIQKAAA